MLRYTAIMFSLLLLVLSYSAAAQKYPSPDSLIQPTMTDDCRTLTSTSMQAAITLDPHTAYKKYCEYCRSGGRLHYRTRDLFIYMTQHGDDWCSARKQIEEQANLQDPAYRAQKEREKTDNERLARQAAEENRQCKANRSCCLNQCEQMQSGNDHYLRQRYTTCGSQYNNCEHVLRNERSTPCQASLEACRRQVERDVSGIRQRKVECISSCSQ